MNFFYGMIVTSSVVLFISSLLRSKYFFVDTEFAMFKIKSVVICIIIKDLNGVFILKKMLATIEFKGFLDSLAIGRCCSNFWRPKQGVFYVHK